MSNLKDLIEPLCFKGQLSQNFYKVLHVYNDATADTEQIQLRRIGEKNYNLELSSYKRGAIISVREMFDFTIITREEYEEIKNKYIRKDL